MVQWLRLCAPVWSSVPAQGTRSCMPQLKIWHAIIKMDDPTCRNEVPQANKYSKVNIIDIRCKCYFGVIIKGFLQYIMSLFHCLILQVPLPDSMFSSSVQFSRSDSMLEII